MTETRRAFVKKGASLAALSAMGFDVAAPAVHAAPASPRRQTDWMPLCLAHFFGFDPTRLQLSRQMGVLGAVGNSGPDLAATKQRYDEAGLTWKVYEGVPLHRAQLGIDGRDEDIERFITLMKGLSEIGVDTLCYNWMPVISWARTDNERRSRGGSRVTAFDAEAIADTSLTEYGAFTPETLWANLAYFLNAVVPEAERYGIKLALHPDDPPVDQIRGIPRIMTSVEAFQRMLDLYPSPNNGITFCQGSSASMGDLDIPAAIRLFGERGAIHFVHFRDVRGHTTNFEETWHDDGKTDMHAAMQAYYDVGFRGPLRPDHVPTVVGDSNEHPGYSTMGTLFAIGYIRGLMEAVAKRRA